MRTGGPSVDLARPFIQQVYRLRVPGRGTWFASSLASQRSRTTVNGGRVMVEGQFHDRADAGRQLAAALGVYKGASTIVLGLPRGGIPVAFQVAQALGAPLGAFVVRKLGVPGQPELALGALASGGIRVLNDDLIRDLRIPPHVIEEVASREAGELARREQLFAAAGTPAIAGRTVILVDDGLATGATMRAAVRAVRVLGAGRVVVAVPVGAPETCRDMLDEADAVVCLRMPSPFSAVGLWYRTFDQTGDDEVQRLLESSPAALTKRD
jgi:predicted phosphoribosyltransferase